MTRRRYRKIEEDSSAEMIFKLVVIFIFLGGGWLAFIYMADKTKFWDTINNTVYPVLGVLLVALMAFIVFRIWYRRMREHHVDELLHRIDENGLRGEVLAFLDRFGKEKGKDNWEYRGYSFDWIRLDEFQDILKQKGIDISQKNHKELCTILRQYIDEKEKNFVQASITANSSHHFSELNRTGDDFEHLVARLYDAMGYSSKRIGAHGDQGGDVIANKNGESVLVQAKCYEGSVGNAAVQQAAAARQHYGCNKAVVITTSLFTAEAIALAKSNSVELIDRTILQQRLAEYLHESWK